MLGGSVLNTPPGAQSGTEVLSRGETQTCLMEITDPKPVPSILMLLMTTGSFDTLWRSGKFNTHSSPGRALIPILNPLEIASAVPVGSARLAGGPTFPGVELQAGTANPIPATTPSTIIARR